MGRCRPKADGRAEVATASRPPHLWGGVGRRPTEGPRWLQPLVLRIYEEVSAETASRPPHLWGGVGRRPTEGPRWLQPLVLPIYGEVAAEGRRRGEGVICSWPQPSSASWPASCGRSRAPS